MFDGPFAPELDVTERRARLRPARSRRIGPVTFHEALQHFGSAQRACRELAVIPEREIAREEQALAKLGGRFLVLGDADYPTALAALPDAPPVLSMIGDAALLVRPCWCGPCWRSSAPARRRWQPAASPPISTPILGQHGFAIVSGLARGIYAAVHEAALETGTVAVLAGGIDQVYPPQNEALQAAIAKRGLLLAETPFGASPIARSFPRRNRTVSGLSAGVIVVEAAERSGSLITAQRALEQGREVFVVPGSPMGPRYAGSNSLPRDGAILVRGANDITSVFGTPQSALQPVEKQRETPKDSATATVLAALGAVPTAVDELVHRCQVSAATVAEVLLALELEGRLERHRGNCVSLI